MRIYPTWLFAFLAALCAGCGRSKGTLTGVVHASRSFSHHTYTVVDVDLTRASLKLFWKRPEGTSFGSFNALQSFLEQSNFQLEFAANASIFDQNLAPLGLHVEHGKELMPLNTKTGTGNFYLRPNGVFLVDDKGAKIMETKDYEGTTSEIELATQSGPLLMENRRINSVFVASSKNRRIRSGVGITDSKHIVFVLSSDRVTFLEFAETFQSLNCVSALYLDGEISRFTFPNDHFDSPPRPFAGMFAVSARD